MWLFILSHLVGSSLETLVLGMDNFWAMVNESGGNGQKGAPSMTERRQQIKAIDYKIQQHHRALGRILDDRYTRLSENAEALLRAEIKKLEKERAALEAR